METEHKNRTALLVVAALLIAFASCTSGFFCGATLNSIGEAELRNDTMREMDRRQQYR